MERRSLLVLPLADVDSYSDVTRISEPVMSGFRLLLEYRLYGSKYQEIETAGAMARYAKDFEKELSRWNNLQKSGKADPLLVYVLDDCPQHDPEDAVLTGADDLKEKYLVERCANTGMCAYLAQLQSTVDAYSNSGNSYELHSLISLAGVKTPDASRKIEIKQIISDDFFKNRDSNDSEYGTKDPWEKVYEYHLKDMVRFRDFLIRHVSVCSLQVSALSESSRVTRHYFCFVAIQLRTRRLD